MAAISRTSVRIVSLPPTRSNACSCSTRRILACRGQRHVADLVEEERAAVALLELADAAAVGAGEGALLVAEQLALQQGLRDGGAVEGQERRLGPGAVLVDGAGDQFLAGAALAGDQHRHVLGGDAADGLVDLAHGRAGADDGAVHVGVRGGLGDHGRLAHPPGHLQRLADHPPQLVQVERLEQVVVGALLHRLDGRVRRLGHGDEDDRDARVDPADLLVDLQPGLVGQAQVEQNDIRRLGARRARAPRRRCRPPRPGERGRGTPGAPAPGSGPGRRP